MDRPHTPIRSSTRSWFIPDTRALFNPFRRLAQILSVRRDHPKYQIKDLSLHQFVMLLRYQI